MRRRATRLWWMRSISEERRAARSVFSVAVWAHSGRSPLVSPDGPTTWYRRERSISSSLMSFNKKVRAERARTRCRTIPVVGPGEPSVT